jgi:hypothetical protein
MAFKKFYHRHMVDIPRITLFVQRRYRVDWSFVDGHWLGKNFITHDQFPIDFHFGPDENIVLDHFWVICIDHPGDKKYVTHNVDGFVKSPISGKLVISGWTLDKPCLNRRVV